MFLQATIVPPSAVLEAIAEAVQAAEPPVDTPPPPEPPRRGALGRLSGRAVQVAEPPVELVSEFELIPAFRLHLPIAVFGNVTMGDAIKIAAAMKGEAAQWATPTVRFAGTAVQEFPAHRSVVMTMDGDVDELLSVARAVTQCAQRRGLRFDRRKFLPMLEVATIGESATSARVMRFLNALEGFQGEPWTVDHFSLAKRSFDSASIDEAEFQRILLGPH